MKFYREEIKNFKSKYRNKYYYIKSHYEIINRYLLINLIKLLLCPLYFFFIPINIYFYRKKIFFLIDIMSGIGHIIPEFDYFFYKNGHKNKIILIYDKNKDYSIIKKNYKFYKIYKLGISCLAVKVFLNFFPKIVLDCSQTLPDHKMPINLFSKRYKAKYHFKKYNEYFKYRSEHNSFFLEILNKSQKQNRYLESSKKIACLHYRENISHSIPMITNPSTYIKSIEMLIDKGYLIYFIGREKIPEIFKKYKIINYANSNEASIENDFNLAYASSLSLICGSGVSYIPDTLEKKYLYLNSFHLSRPGGLGSKSIVLPSKVFSKKENRELNFIEQINLENSQSHLSSSYLNKNKFDLVHANENDILNALLELEEIENGINISKEQKLFMKKYSKYGWLKTSKSVLSQNFLIQNMEKM